MADLKKTFELAFAIGGKLDPSFKTSHSQAASEIAKLSKKSSEAMAFAKLNREYNAAMQNFTKAANNMGAAWSKVGASILNPLKQIIALGAVAGAAVYGLAYKTAKMGDEAVKTASKIGITTQEYSKLSFAATQSGLSANQFSGSMLHLNKIIQQNNATGKKDLIINGRRILSMRDENKKIKDRSRLLYEAADAFTKLKDENEKTTLATLMFGKSGVDMIPMLEQGSSGIQKLMKDAERLGIVFDDAAGRRATAFMDSMGELKAAAQGLAMTVGQQLHEPLTRVNNAIVGWITANRELIGQKVNEFVQDIIKWVKENKENIIGLKNSVVEFIHQVGIWIEKNGGLVEVLKKVGKAFLALKALGIVFSIISALTATATFILSLIKLVTATKAVVAAFGGLKVIGGVIAGLTGPVIAVIAAVAALGTATYLLIKNWEDVVYFFKNLGTTVPLFIDSIIEDIKGAFGRLPGWLQNILAPIKNIIISPIQAVQDLLAGNIKGFIINMGKFIIGKLTLIPSLIATTGNEIIKALFGVDILGAIKDWITPSLNVLSDMLGVTIDTIKNFFIGEFSRIKEAFGGGFFNGIFEILKSIPTLFIRMGNDVVNALFGVDLIGVGKEWLAGFVAGVSGIYSAVQNVFGKSVALVKGIAKDIVNIFTTVVGTVKDFFIGEFVRIKEAFKGGFFKGIAEVVKSVPTLFIRMIADVAKALVRLDIVSIGKGWLRGFGEVLGGIDNILMRIVTLIPRLLNDAVKAITGVDVIGTVKAWLDPIVDTVAGVFDNVKGVFFGAVDFVKGFFLGDLMGIKEAFSGGFLNGIKEIFVRLGTLIPRLLNDAVKAITGVDIFKAGKDWIQRFIDGVLAILKTAAGAVKDAVKGLLPESLINLAGGAAKTVGSAVKTVTGILPKFGDGGIATKPSLVAEDGKPEMVIPLTKPKRAAQLFSELAPTVAPELQVIREASPVLPESYAQINRPIPPTPPIVPQPKPPIPPTPPTLPKMPKAPGVSDSLNYPDFFKSLFEGIIDIPYSLRPKLKKTDYPKPQSLDMPEIKIPDISNNDRAGGEFNFSPNITITVNGGEPTSIKTAVEDALKEAKAQFERWYTQMQYNSARVATR